MFVFTVFMFIWFSPSFFVFVRRNQKGNLVFKMTRGEDAHLTLVAIPLRVNVNNSILFAVTNIREKIAEFLILWDL